MAGTIVADTLQNGAGTSTSMTNAISGSAKAWVTFNGNTGSIYASYNVSSVTITGTGTATINFTSAFSDTNYCAVCCADGSGMTATPDLSTYSTTQMAFQVWRSGTFYSRAYSYAAIFR